MLLNSKEQIHSRIGIGDDAPMKVRTVEELYKLCQEGKDVYVHLGQVWKKIHVVAADDALKTTCIAIVRSHYKVEHLCSNDTRFMAAVKTGIGSNANVQIEPIRASKIKKTTVLQLYEPSLVHHLRYQYDCESVLLNLITFWILPDLYLFYNYIK